MFEIILNTHIREEADAIKTHSQHILEIIHEGGLSTLPIEYQKLFKEIAENGLCLAERAIKHLDQEAAP